MDAFGEEKGLRSNDGQSSWMASGAIVVVVLVVLPMLSRGPLLEPPINMRAKNLFYHFLLLVSQDFSVDNGLLEPPTTSNR